MAPSSCIFHLLRGLTAASVTLISSVSAADVSMPDPTSADFCVAVQNIVANTDVPATNTVFDNMPDYRHSKPSPDPLMIYQVVTYDDKRPVMVSCKIKSADHIRATYGEDAAGEQGICAYISQRIKAQAVRELDIDNPSAIVDKARAFVINVNEPYTTGRSYLSDFELSYVGEDGNIHFNSPGLQVDWDDWKFWLMPNKVRGQTYCHIPTVSYMKAIATGALEPGTVMKTTDDVQTTPLR